MAHQRQVSLQAAQAQELLWTRKHHPKAYVRERAAAILKVAAGTSMRQVAAHGLLQTRTEEAVSQWLDRYLEEGLTGLLVRKGRGRKPAFSPCAGSTRRGTGDR